jgi:dTDP-4-dehydrorhamnose reductase
MRILVSGITGLVGSHIAMKAKERGWKVGGISRNPANIPSLYLAKDEVGIELAMDDFRPDIFVDCSAWSHVDACETNPVECLRINSLLPGLISSIAFARGIQYVLFSSSYVFSGEKVSYNESDSAGPLSWYGEAKVLAEKLVTFNTRGRGLVIRTMGVYGMDPAGKDFYGQVVRAISSKNIIQVANDQFGNTTFAADLAEVTLRLTEWSSSGIWHVAGPDPLQSRYMIAKEICRLGGWNVKYLEEVPTTSLHQKAPRPRYGGLDIFKILSKGLKMRSLEEVWSK